MKKLLCAVLCLCLFASLCVCAAETGIDYTSDFSRGTDGWYARSEGTAYIEVRDNALFTGGRAASWNSPGRDFDLEPGVTYDISVQVVQSEAASADFMISVAHKKGEVETYENLAFVSAKKGRWMSMSCAYTPGQYDSYVLYVETNGSPELSFTFRNFTVKARGISAAESLPSLKELYSDYFVFGCAVTQMEALNTKRMDFYASQFGVMTPGNELKPDSVLDVAASRRLAKEDETAVAVRFNAAKPMLDYCFKNGVKVHGHTLLWHNQTPEAFFHEGYDAAKPFVSREVMLARLDNYIRLVMETLSETYPGLIVSWDVVNEAVDDNSARLRSSNWTKVVGDDFVNRAFEIARKYAPEGTLLFYNDYSTPYEPKLTGICRLLDSLIAEGNIDGYGFQTHYQLSTPSIDQVSRAYKKIAEKGLLLRVSEMDIALDKLNDAAYQQQAERYASLMREFLAYSDQLIAVQTWGVTDDLSWLGGKNPLLFDRDFQPKPAFYALVDLVDGEN